VNYERNQIIYIAAFGKRYNLTYRKWLNIKEKEPNNYFDFLNDIRINNEEAAISPYYYYFLNEYFVQFIPDNISKMDVSERKKIIGLEYIEAADSLLTGEVKDIYKSFIICRYIIDSGLYQLSEEIIHKQRINIIDDKYINYLEGYLTDKATLSSGMRAPEFYLLNTNNEYTTLADYKGKVILLNFWFPGCTPCIKEIPFEKRLVDDFNNKDFHLINICLFTTEESWRNAISKLGMKGINLFANENWQKKLIENYKISSYPHYTLIDNDGIIFSNSPKRPSEGVSEDILNLLNN
jgi:thiol-disulfide isomerase/thioredoxin